jgi:hypothetical protein
LSRSAGILLTAYLRSENVSNILGSEFELSNNNLNPFYENNAAQEDKKMDILALCFNHLKLWIKSVQNSIEIIKPVMIASTGRHIAHTKHLQRNDITIVVVYRKIGFILVQFIFT